jgi:hypothetical protein
MLNTIQSKTNFHKKNTQTVVLKTINHKDHHQLNTNLEKLLNLIQKY